MAYIGRDIDKISNVEVLDNITFDGSSSYTLQKGGSNFTPSSANTLLVSIDGVVQAGNFTVSGSTINFGTAVSASSTCNFILHYGVGLITAPADGTVTTAKLADSSVSLAKLTATGTKDATTFLRGDNTFATPAGGTNTPAFEAYIASNQSMPYSTATKINFDTEVFDTHGMYDTTNKRFTPTVAGKYLVYAHCAFSAEGLDRFHSAQMMIYKNGANYKEYYFDEYNNYFSYAKTTTGSVVINFNGSTDYVEVYGAFSYTLGQGVVYNARYSTFGAYKIIE